MVRTPPPHLRGSILALQISRNALHPPRPLLSDDQSILQPLVQVQAVVIHQHPEEPHWQTECIAFYPATHPALLALPLLPAVLNACVPQSLMQKPARLLQIHCKRELQKAIRDSGSGTCNRRGCLHLEPRSLAVAASIYLLTQTWRVMYLQRSD